MKCPICGKDVELRKKQIGTSENGDPIFNEYAICRDCKKQWNLDKQRAKKMAAKNAAAKAVKSEEKAGEKPTEKVSSRPEAKPVSGSAEKTTAKPVGKTVEKAVGKTDGKAVPKAAEKTDGKAVAKAVHTAGKSAVSGAAAEAGSSDGTAAAPAKKSARTAASKSGEKSSERPAKRTVSSSEEKSAAKPVRKKSTSPDDASAPKKNVKKRTSAGNSSSSGEEKAYGNIPSQKQRTKSEKAVRKGYEEMLSTDPNYKPAKKKKASAEDEEKKGTKSSASRKSADRHAAGDKTSRKAPEPVDTKEDDYDDYYDDVPRFRAARIILAVISLAGFAFFAYRGFTTGLSSVSAGDDSNAGMTYIILALCMLVAALLYLIMQRRNTIFAFLLPMILYLGSAVCAFLMRSGDVQLLISAVVSGVLALISLILAITSRGGYDDEDNYDDPFEDDYAE